jgi:hypothetical protein
MPLEDSEIKDISRKMVLNESRFLEEGINGN